MTDNGAELELDTVNARAHLLAAVHAGELPAVEIGGVLVTVYRDRDDKLRVTLDTSEAKLGVWAAGGLPGIAVQVDVNNGTVYTSEPDEVEVELSITRVDQRTVTVPWPRLAAAWRADNPLALPGDPELDEVTGEVGGSVEELFAPITGGSADSMRIVSISAAAGGGDPT